MKAILINAEARTITEVEYNGDYRHIYELIGTGESPFTTVNLGEGDALFVDDEGLLKPYKFGFHYKGYDQILVGSGLVLGSDNEGESTEPKIHIERVKGAVTFYQIIEGAWHPLSTK